MKSGKLDEKDKKILMLLQKNGRISLKQIAQSVNLSIDTVHKRIKNMIENNVMTITTSINPEKVGYPIIADIKIKLKNLDQEKRNKFINYMISNSRCTDLIAITGDYDFTAVLIAKTNEDLEKLTTNIRTKFKDIIGEWKSNIILKVYKFDTYSL